ncbi:hypothetical protein DFJ43DRAFT_1161677 [Lentinula guzmanii]|uniref:Uncharacterized protein n=1 Tax=Lentinula guzmanii TaxID=2804957 RepID=A0AA38JCY1_9AGAR|nr:hypothetical protein DFJ43DRAFT_1161677 [Lentinula guzmanii]
MNPEPSSPFNDESSVPTASVGHPSTPAPAQQYTNQPVYYYLPSPVSYPPQTPAPKNHSRVSTVGYGAGSDSETLPLNPIREALERILNAIQHEKWSLGKFLYYLFRTKSDDSAQLVYHYPHLEVFKSVESGRCILAKSRSQYITSPIPEDIPEYDG